MLKSLNLVHTIKSNIKVNSSTNTSEHLGLLRFTLVQLTISIIATTVNPQRQSNSKDSWAQDIGNVCDDKTQRHVGILFGSRIVRIVLSVLALCKNQQLWVVQVKFKLYVTWLKFYWNWGLQQWKDSQVIKVGFLHLQGAGI